MYVAERGDAATSYATRPYIGFPFACSSDPCSSATTSAQRRITERIDELSSVLENPESAATVLKTLDHVGLYGAMDRLQRVVRQNGRRRFWTRKPPQNGLQEPPEGNPDQDGNQAGAEGPFLRKRTLAYCTQYRGSG